MSRRSKSRTVREQRHCCVEPEPQDSGPTYFVPSLAVVRRASLDDGSAVDMHRRVARRWRQDDVYGKVGGRYLRMIRPEDWTMKAIERGKLIVHLRSAGLQPSPDHMREVAYNLRDDLAERLAKRNSKLVIPLGGLGLYGADDTVVGVGLLGWKGYGGRYAEFDEVGNAHPLNLLAAEHRMYVDHVAPILGDEAPLFEDDADSRNPYLDIMRSYRHIHGDQFRVLQSSLDGQLEPELTLDDPVILLRTDPRQKNPEIISVRTDA